MTGNLGSITRVAPTLQGQFSAVILDDPTQQSTR